MIIYVDMEHPTIRLNTALAKIMSDHTLHAKYKIEEITNKHCHIVRYDRFSKQIVNELNPQAIIIGGHFSIHMKYDPDSLRELDSFALNPDRPLLGICGGHQLIGRVHGSEIIPMDKAMEPLPDPVEFEIESHSYDTASGRFGFLPVSINKPEHALMKGFSDQATFLHLHSWQISALPEGFETLATSGNNTIQAMAHHKLPIFGLQSHPEGFTEQYPDGRTLLYNFLTTDWHSV